MTIPALPAGTSLGKSFEYGLDINLGTYASPIWQPFRRISGFAPAYPKTSQDVQTYDDRGAPNSDVSGIGFSFSLNQQVHRDLTSGLYLPETEAILAASSRPTSTGDAAVVDLRWYHKPEVGTPNPNDARRGFATVDTSRTNTGPNGEIETLTINVTGKGVFEMITNPFTSWGTLAPTIVSIAPEGAGDGELVTITGTSFLTVTGVTVNGDAAEFNVINDSTLSIGMPVGDAGAVPVVVTNPTGASAAFSYTRGS